MKHSNGLSSLSALQSAFVLFFRHFVTAIEKKDAFGCFHSAWEAYSWDGWPNTVRSQIPLLSYLAPR